MKRVLILLYWQLFAWAHHGVGETGETSIHLGVQSDCHEEIVFDIFFRWSNLHVSLVPQHKEYHYQERGVMCIFGSYASLVKFLEFGFLSNVASFVPGESKLGLTPFTLEP